MNTYHQFAKRLLELLGDSEAVRITVPGFMPLTIEAILPNAAGGVRHISLTHYGKQNGDLMRDPEMVFSLRAGAGDATAEPIYFRNDYVGVEQFVYECDPEGTATHVRPKLKRELKGFARIWFRNLRAQGFFRADAKRESLA